MQKKKSTTIKPPEKNETHAIKLKYNSLFLF